MCRRFSSQELASQRTFESCFLRSGQQELQHTKSNREECDHGRIEADGCQHLL